VLSTGEIVAGEDRSIEPPVGKERQAPAG
jgi:hypothetical protein